MLLRGLAQGLAAVSPSLAARALEWVFLKARRHAPPAREQGWMKGACPARLESGAHALAVWSWGAGPTVLLVHGWEGRGSQMGAFAAPLVAAGFRVVTFDAPGHGRSTGGRSSLVEMADAVTDVGRWAGPLFAVVAHSAGAAVTTMALGEGLAAQQAVYLAPPSDPGKFLYAASDFLGLDREIARRTQKRIEERFGILWGGLRVTELGPGMTTPLLIFHDRDDREVTFDQGQEVAAAWPGARLIPTTGLGHRRPLRDRGVVTTAVQHLGQAKAKAFPPRALPQAREPEPVEILSA